MLGYKVELKSKQQIKSLCYEVEGGGLGQDGIAFDYDLLHSNKFMTIDDVVTLEGVLAYDDDSYAYVVKNVNGGKVAVHIDWIARYNDSPVVELKKLTDELTQVTRKYLIEVKTGKLVPKSTLPTCGHCGALGTITMHDGKHLCGDCNQKLTVNHNYTYKPTYKYVGKQIPKDVANPVWFGMEIEMSTDREKLGKYMYEYGKDLYLKDDSSIRGDGFRTELVTMPHSFTSLMAEDSWLNNLHKIPNVENNANGAHIHISRTSFVDDTHYSLFYFLMHKMEGIATKVGGRDLTNYCELMPTGKVFTKKNGKEGGNGRSLFLNEQNDATIEARFFKGTTNKESLRAYVQLLESVLKYTKHHPEGGTVKGWFEYISQKSKKYAELLLKVGTISSEDLEIAVYYREPKKSTKKLANLTLTDISNISSVTLRSGQTYNGEIKQFYIREQKLEIRTTDGDTNVFRFREIASVVIEEE